MSEIAYTVWDRASAAFSPITFTGADAKERAEQYAEATAMRSPEIIKNRANPPVPETKTVYTTTYRDGKTSHSEDQRQAGPSESHHGPFIDASPTSSVAVWATSFISKEHAEQLVSDTVAFIQAIRQQKTLDTGTPDRQ